MTQMHMTKAPGVDVGLLVRSAPGAVFGLLVDPAVTTKFWYTKSSGPMVAGAHLVWEWEMYGARVDVTVDAVEADRLLRFRWTAYDAEAPTEVTVELEPKAG